MNRMGNAAKEDLHELVEALPENEVLAARRYLEFLSERGEDPVRRALDNAPEDDEPETAEEAAAVDEARAAIARGEVVSHDEMKRRLGL